MLSGRVMFQGRNSLCYRGIPIILSGDMKSAHLYAVPERHCACLLAENNLPLMVDDENHPTPGKVLVRASLVGGSEGDAFYLSEEYDQKDAVIVFIDTFDRNHTDFPGRYSLPRNHDCRLPAGRFPTSCGGADFGLVVLTPSNYIIVQSTAGVLVRLVLPSSGALRFEHCTKADRTLFTFAAL